MGKLGAALTLPARYANFVGNGFERNNIFDLNSSGCRDNCYSPYVCLKHSFLFHGIELNTPDVNQVNKVLFELHMDVQPRICKDIPSYVMLYETPQVKPLNQRKDLLAKYRRIFTWNDDWVDGQRYIKINLPKEIVVDRSRGWEGRERLCCLIAGNKSTRQISSLELYSERVKTIRWFERCATQDFDLFGNGWDAPAARQGFLGKAVGRLHRQVLTRTGKVFFPSYRGKVVSKLETLRNYRFSICYENVRGLPGYITEKIFDSFFAGCLPVYWGAYNISDYIPEDCFIDRRKFVSHEKLYQFMVSMTEPEFIAYQERIATFLTSDRAKPFTSEIFSKSIVKTIVRDLGITD